MPMVARLSESLAAKSSRRRFMKLLSGSALGTGLWLTNSGVSLASHVQCASCPGGPCNPLRLATPALLFDWPLVQGGV